jgi:hypothetical protein
MDRVAPGNTWQLAHSSSWRVQSEAVAQAIGGSQTFMLQWRCIVLSPQCTVLAPTHHMGMTMRRHSAFGIRLFSTQRSVKSLRNWVKPKCVCACVCEYHMR